MNERKGIVTLQGNPMVLLGKEIKPGDKAPDALLVKQNMAPVNLSSYFGGVLIISAVPSLDTPVCDVETRRFNKEASELGEGTRIITISMDLPFAQKRWCGAAGVKNVEVLSDYQRREFGEKYGVLIKDIMLLARTVFIVDKKGTVQYVQVVKEVSKEPDYNAVLKAARELAS